MRSHEPERRAWFDAVTVAVLAHVLLLAALVVSSGHRAHGESPRDVANTRGALPPAPGFGPPPSTGPLFVSCSYIVDAATQVARLSTGPSHSDGRLGCRPTLARMGAIPWPTRLTLTYDSDGALIQINQHVVSVRDPLRMLVESWDLATPRAGRVWPGMPSFTLRIAQ
jgi:hypothetical protein